MGCFVGRMVALGHDSGEARLKSSTRNDFSLPLGGNHFAGVDVNWRLFSNLHCFLRIPATTGPWLLLTGGSRASASHMILYRETARLNSGG